MIEPWKHESYSDTYYNYFRQRGYKRVYSTVEDSPRLWLRKGDIVEFGSGYYENLNGWKEWFLTEREDKKKFWPRDATPFYAQNQYAIVVNRYKWTKYKHTTFADYGVIVMMITGSAIGHIRKFYANRPFKKKSFYPHNEKIKGRFIKMKKPFTTIANELFLPGFNITSFLNGIKKKYGDGEEGRDLFLEKMCLLLGVEL